MFKHENLVRNLLLELQDLLLESIDHLSILLLSGLCLTLKLENFLSLVTVLFTQRLNDPLGFFKLCLGLLNLREHLVDLLMENFVDLSKSFLLKSKDVTLDLDTPELVCQLGDILLQNEYLAGPLLEFTLKLRKACLFFLEPSSQLHKEPFPLIRLVL